MSKPTFSSVMMKVKKILDDHPEARDDDALVFGFFIHTYHYDTGKTVIAQLIRDMKNGGAFPKFNYILRARQKLQSQYPALRGVRYEERQKKGNQTKRNKGSL